MFQKQATPGDDVMVLHCFYSETFPGLFKSLSCGSSVGESPTLSKPLGKYSIQVLICNALPKSRTNSDSVDASLLLSLGMERKRIIWNKQSQAWEPTRRTGKSLWEKGEY